MSTKEREKVDGCYIHDKKDCDAPCPFHSPSEHPLNQADIHIRVDKNFLVERICSHGVGHDDPDSVRYMHKHGQSWAGVHGCDGCCSGTRKPTFKEEYPELNENQRKAFKRKLLSMLPKKLEYKNRFVAALAFPDKELMAHNNAIDETRQEIEEYFQ